MNRTENYFNTVVTFFTDQYLKYIMLNMSKTQGLGASEKKNKKNTI